jgi:hypothetical protein
MHILKKINGSTLVIVVQRSKVTGNNINAVVTKALTVLINQIFRFLDDFLN